MRVPRNDLPKAKSIDAEIVRVKHPASVETIVSVCPAYEVQSKHLPETSIMSTRLTVQCFDSVSVGPVFLSVVSRIFLNFLFIFTIASGMVGAVLSARVHGKHVNGPFPVSVLARLAYSGTDTATPYRTGNETCEYSMVQLEIFTPRRSSP